MSKIVDWEGHIGRRLRLRDLHVFFTVVQFGSMAKAAAHLRVTQPAVSQVIADLEHTLGVRLLDRRPDGVKPTSTATRCSRAVPQLLMISSRPSRRLSSSPTPRSGR